MIAATLGIVHDSIVSTNPIRNLSVEIYMCNEPLPPMSFSELPRYESIDGPVAEFEGTITFEDRIHHIRAYQTQFFRIYNSSSRDHKTLRLLSDHEKDEFLRRGNFNII